MHHFRPVIFAMFTRTIRVAISVSFLPHSRTLAVLKTFTGPVYTVQCFEDNTFVKQAVDSQGWIDTPTGRVAQVLLVDGGASLRRALLGAIWPQRQPAMVGQVC